jgi:hypothetical protein
MIRRRAVAAGIHAPIGNHTFRATGITAYLANGGALEHAQEMAAHESPRTTKLYDRTKERLTELCGIFGDGVNQAADFFSDATSIPSRNVTPLTTFGN